MHHAKTSNKMAPPSINIQISHLQQVEAEARAPTPTRIRYKPATTSNTQSKEETQEGSRTGRAEGGSPDGILEHSSSHPEPQ